MIGALVSRFRAWRLDRQLRRWSRTFDTDHRRLLIQEDVKDRHARMDRPYDQDAWRDGGPEPIR